MRISASLPQGRKILLSLNRRTLTRNRVALNNTVVKRFAKQVREFAELNGYDLFTYTNNTDQSFARHLAGLCGRGTQTLLQGENHLLPEELVFLFSRFNFVIASQMHAGVFAYLAGVRVLSLIYDDKVREFAKRIGNRNCLDMTQLADSKKVAEALIRASTSRRMVQRASVHEGSEKLLDMLNELIWSDGDIV